MQMFASKVTLVRWAGSDLDVCNGARVSFNREHGTLTEADEGLIHRLVKDGHTEPLRGVWAKFKIVCSIGCARQVMTNKRTLAINERSTRYSEFSDEFIIPPLKRQVGKPMDYTYEPLEATELNAAYQKVYESYMASYKTYSDLLKDGISKEDARSVLPLGMQTALIVSGDLVGWLRFLSRRTHPHAQLEIRTIANTIEKDLGTIAPITLDAWRQTGRRPL